MFGRRSRSGYQGTTAASFLRVVLNWLAREGEVLVLLRFHAAAGAREFRIFKSMEEFEACVHGLRPRTCVIVIAGKQLPLRGRVDPAFIAAAVESLPEGPRWLVVALEPTVLGKTSWFYCADGTTHSELVAELESELGSEVTVGAHPDWFYDSETVISAVVPEPNGIVVTGIY